jgi:tyrosyl-tRNA synthetase
MDGKKEKIQRSLSKNVEQILPDKEKLAVLMSKRKIRLYNGIDPTGTKLHLGHSIPLRKLQEFADLGHEAIIVVGTGTVLAGDPSLRDKARPKITQKEIKDNIKTWKKQASKVLDFSKVKIKYNGDWLTKLKLAEILDIASNISAVQLFQRDMFQKRLEKGGTVWMNEVLYPILQGYDSVYMDVDLEIGGTDQVFNMLVGRDLMQKMKSKEKFVMTLPMILGTDGKPMSKSSGNCIWLDDEPNEMYGKIMSIPDEIIIPYFKTLTDIPEEKIFEYEENIKNGTVNPVELKKKLAIKIVEMYHGKKSSLNASEEFNRIFCQNEMPSEMPKIEIKEEKINILELLVKTKITSSRAEARRLIEQGGVKINGEIQNDWKKEIKTEKEMIIQAGKRKFVKII